MVDRYQQIDPASRPTGAPVAENFRLGKRAGTGAPPTARSLCAPVTCRSIPICAAA